MAQIVTLPSLGFAIIDATIMKWLKNEGDPVAKDEPIAEMSSAKVTYEVVSPMDGILLKQYHTEGATVKVDHPIAVVGLEGESVEDAEVPTSMAGVDASEEIAGKTKGDDNTIKDLTSAKAKKIKATPAAKSLARQRGIDLSLITPTGINGIITREDVEAYQATPKLEVPAPIPEALEEEEIIPFTGVRKTIADNLLSSYTNAVHVTTSVEVDMTDADYFRRMLRDSLYETNKIKISFMPFFIKAAVIGLKEFPILNASLDGDRIIVKKSVDFSIAVDTQKGLLLPVLKSAEKKTFMELAEALNSIISAGKEDAIPPEYFGNGTISISNAGAYGAVTSTPIIPKGQSAVIWTGAILEKPAVFNNEIVPRKIMNLCVSYDHRIMDGAKVAQFLGVMKKYLENPALLLIS